MMDPVTPAVPRALPPPAWLTALITCATLAGVSAQAQTAPVPATAASAVSAPAGAASAPVAATPAPALAAQPVGYVKTVTGEVFITTGGQRVAARPGTPVLAGSTVRTQPGASVGITCIDNTLLALGPDTTFTLDEYAYAPAQGKLGLLATLTRGTLNYVSGVIARLQPEAVKVKTPSGIIGVRGTEFAAKVEVEK